MSRGHIELERDELIRALNDDAGRKTSTTVILYELAIAERLGLGLTDLVCGEILARTGAITAGELAELSGLSTGAITGVVDRLEKAGYVRRVNDPNDRRRVMLDPLERNFHERSGDAYKALERRFGDLYAEYSDQELATHLDILRQSLTIFDEETVRLREGSSARAPKKPPMEQDIQAGMGALAGVHVDMRMRMGDNALIHVRKGGGKDTRLFSTPRGNLTEARLESVSGAVQYYIRGERDIPELYRAEFRHDIPIVRDNDGVVAIQYRHRTLFGRGGGRGDIELNTETRWFIELECGASNIEADLRDLELRGLTFRSKASKLYLLLPRPKGTIRIQLASPASSLQIKRPKGVPVRLEFDGEGGKLHFDKRRLTVTDGTHETRDYAAATDRYLIEFAGPTSKINVEEEK